MPHAADDLHGPRPAARHSGADAPAQLIKLLSDRNQPPVARATAAIELAAFAEPGNDVTSALQKATADRDAQVRAAAVLGLQPDGSEPTVSALVPLLKDPTRLVRTEAARSLAQITANRLQGEEWAAFKAALQECFDGATADNDRASGHMSLGILYESFDDFPQAEQAYQTAIRVEPSSIGP